MTVYIDLYFIINTILNFFILQITKSVIKSKSTNPRLLLSSMAGALFAILILFPQTDFINGIVGKIILSIYVFTRLCFKSFEIFYHYFYKRSRKFKFSFLKMSNPLDNTPLM